MKKLLFHLTPIFILAALTPFLSKWDIFIEEYFFRDGHFINNGLTKAIFRYALIPCWLVITGSLIACFHPKFKNIRPAAYLMILSLLIGGGIIINASLKEYWGRPRPKETINFGGKYEYRPYYSPNFSSPANSCKSFPSGHASAGFYFFSLCILGRQYKNKMLTWIGITSTIILGGMLGFVRLIQGGHFLSDVIVSAIIMWYTPLLIGMFIWRKHERNN